VISAVRNTAHHEVKVVSVEDLDCGIFALRVGHLESVLVCENAGCNRHQNMDFGDGGTKNFGGRKFDENYKTQLAIKMAFELVN
jgi:hypothetical protein